MGHEASHDLCQVVSMKKRMQFTTLEDLVNKAPAFKDLEGHAHLESLATYVSDQFAQDRHENLWLYHKDTGVFRMSAHPVEKVGSLVMGDDWTNSYKSTLTDHLRNKARKLPEQPTGDHLAVSNGWLDWRTGKLAPHSPDNLATVALNVPWDPNAKCPKWEAWLKDRVPTDAIPVLQELFGFYLRNGNEDQRAGMFYGPTGSGKSAATRILQAMIHPDYVASLTLYEVAHETFAGGDLFGKLLNISGEQTDELGKVGEATFKRLTGGDTSRVNQKFKQAFSARLDAKHLFSTNELPLTDTGSEAFLRRWVIVPFPQKIPERDSRVEAGLLTELPGIFVWAIEGLRRLEARGFKFEQTASEQALIRQMREGSNVIVEMLNAGTVMRRATGAFTAFADIRNAVSAYIPLGQQTPTDTKLGRLLRDADLTKSTSGPRGWYGLELAPPNRFGVPSAFPEQVRTGCEQVANRFEEPGSQSGVGNEQVEQVSEEKPIYAQVKKPVSQKNLFNLFDPSRDKGTNLFANLSDEQVDLFEPVQDSSNSGADPRTAEPTEVKTETPDGMIPDGRGGFFPAPPKSPFETPGFIPTRETAALSDDEREQFRRIAVSEE